MTKDQIRLGGLYIARISGRIVAVRIEQPSIHGGWRATNMATGREIRIRTAARLRREV